MKSQWGQRIEAQKTSEDYQNQSVINEILSQTPLPYPTFSDSEQAVYLFLSDACGVNSSDGVRDLYISSNPSVIIDARQTIDEQTVQGGVYNGVSYTAEDFSSVLTQLQYEMKAAIDVSAFFQDWNSLYDTLFTLQFFTETEMLNDVGLSTTSTESISGFITDIIEGVVTSIINLIPDVGGLIAGLINTTYTAVKEGLILNGQLPPNALNTTVENMFTDLGNSFDTLKGNIDLIHQAIVGDMGMSQTLYQNMVSAGSDSPLFWTDDLTNDVTSAAQQAFTLQSLQLLLPVEYAIFYGWIQPSEPTSVNYVNSTSSIFGFSSIDFGSYTPVYKITDAYADFGNKTYWIGKKTSPKSMLDSEKIYDLINGQTDVFLSQNGWSLMCNPYGWENGFLVRIANNSSATFTIVPSWPDGTGIITPANTTLGPYSTLDYFAGISILDKNAKFTIQLNGSDPEDPSINLEFSFAAHLNYGSIFSGGNAVIDLITSSSNSYITVTNTLGASESESNGGSALLILIPNPENDTKLD